MAIKLCISNAIPAAIKASINLHISISQELLLVALAERTVGVTGTSFEVVSQQQYLDVYIGSFFLIASIDSA